jgi:hypothetical protein
MMKSVECCVLESLNQVVQSGPSHPLVTVSKPNRNILVCMDSWKLNSIIIKKSYPVPNLNRILRRLKHTKYLSTVDLQDAFFQILLDDESGKICSFRCPGLAAYRYRTLAFGLHNAAQCLTCVIDKVLGIEMEPYVFYYHDDIIVILTCISSI